MELLLIPAMHRPLKKCIQVRGVVGDKPHRLLYDKLHILRAEKRAGFVVCMISALLFSAVELCELSK